MVSSIRAEHVESDHAGTGSHALDADVAGGRIGLGAEAVDVVDVNALTTDRVGVEERLVAVGGLARSVAGEVLESIECTRRCCWAG